MKNKNVKLMETAWLDYAGKVIPPSASSTQRQECRRAFYAGAQSLLGGLVVLFDEDREPTDDDLKLMDNVAKELQDFCEAVERGRA